MGENARPGASSAPVAGRRAWLAVVLLALLLPSVLAWLEFVVLARSAGAPQANVAVQALYGGGKVLAFCLPLLAVRLLDGHWPRPAKPLWRGLRFGLAFGLLVSAGLFAIYFGALRGTHYLQATPAMIRGKVNDFGLATPAGFLVLGFFISVIHSLLEEYYWRWFVFGNLERLLPLLPALVVSALGFMAHHVIVLAIFCPGRFFTLALPLSLCVAAGGFVWAWLYHQSGSIYSPWLSHMIIDAAIMVVGYDLMFHAGG
jgi:membrane protease YdiL (CAAX protease family)